MTVSPRLSPPVRAHKSRLRHLQYIAVTAGSIVIAAAPAIWIDPDFRRFLSDHPGVAGYLLPAAGVVVALFHAGRDQRNKRRR